MIPSNSYSLLNAELYNAETEFELFNNTKTEFDLLDR